MNDEFLHRLRKQPPAAFAARLRARLGMPTTQSVRPRVSLRALVIGLLAGGTAVAALWISNGMQEGSRDRITAHDSGPANSPDVPAPSIQTAQPAAVSESHEKDATVASAPGVVCPSPAESVPETGARQSVTNRFEAVVPGSSGISVSAGRATLPSRVHIRIAGPALTRELTKMVAAASYIVADLEDLDTDAAIGALCAEEDSRQPEAILATRAITDDEIRACGRAGVPQIAAAKIGYYAVVVSAAKTASVMRVSERDLFLALARRVPGPGDPTQLIDNPYRTWNQVNPALDFRNIMVFGPRPGSTLAHAMSELLLEPGCDSWPWIRALKKDDPGRYGQICHSLREDGAYVATALTDTFVTQTLWAEPNALAVVGFPFFEARRDKFVGSLLEGSEATVASVASTAYRASRPLYVYAPRLKFYRTEGGQQGSYLLGFFQQYTGEEAAGPFGYLRGEGFIPLDPSLQPVRTEVLESPAPGSAAPVRRPGL